MQWCYKALEETFIDEEGLRVPVWSVVEYYEGGGYTSPIVLDGYTSLEDIVEDLEMMLTDIKKQLEKEKQND